LFGFTKIAKESKQESAEFYRNYTFPVFIAMRFWSGN